MTSFAMVPATPDLVMAIEPQRMQAGEKYSMREIDLLLEKGGGIVMLVDGMPLAAGGTFLLAPGRRFAWTVLGHRVGRHFMRVVRALQTHLDGLDEEVEMTVVCGWPEGLRWAALLGFEYRQTLREADHQGRDHDLFVRVPHGG